MNALTNLSLVKNGIASFITFDPGIFLDGFTRFYDTLDKGMEFPELVRKIGMYIDNQKVPLEQRVHYPGSKDVFKAVNNSDTGHVKLGHNTYPVPGSMSSLRALINRQIIAPGSISIDFGNMGNIQEGMKVVKSFHEGTGEQLVLFTDKDKIVRFHLKAGDHTSIAHAVTLVVASAGFEEYAFEIEIGDSTFVGIGSTLGSNTKLGNNVSVWWGSKIRGNSIVGDHAVLGMGAEIGEHVSIPPYSLVPSGAKILETPQMSITSLEQETPGPNKTFSIPYASYVKDKITFNSHSSYRDINSGRRRFVVELFTQDEIQLFSSKGILEEEKAKRLKEIDPDYEVMAKFNELVTDDNSQFGAIDPFLAILDSYTTSLGIKLGIREEYKFKHNLDLIDKFPDLPEEKKAILRNGGDTTVNCKAYPMDREDFIKNGIPAILKIISQGGEEMGEKLKSLVRKFLYFPKINRKTFPDITNEDLSKVCLGECVIIGNAEITDTYLYDTNIRLDETLNNTCEIRNSALIKTTIHGSGPKYIDNSSVISSVIHGASDVRKSTIGEYGVTTIINNSSFLLKNLRLSEYQNKQLQDLLRSHTGSKEEQILTAGIYNMNIGGGTVMNNCFAIGDPNKRYSIGRNVICSASSDSPSGIVKSEIGKGTRILGGNYLVGYVVRPGTFYPSRT